jgi:hypothetical protein
MASAPPQPPESIILSALSGIKNTVSEERLQVGELSAGVNIDLDDAGQARRRRGYRKLDPASWHSVQTVEGITFGVRDGILGRIYPDYSFTALGFVGPEPLCYTSVGDTVYFSSAVTSGKIVQNAIVPWGEPGEGVWISPVIRPTETLGAINGRRLVAPPHATEIESYKGRIYLAHENVLWHTELYLYDRLDSTKNFLQTEDPITMVRATTDGIYVGTTAQLLFLQGIAATGLKMSIIMTTPVVKGSSVIVPYSKAHPRARQGPIPEGEGPMFMTGAGICLGLEGGEVYNLTQDHVVFPGAVSAAALYREDQGANSYVAVADSAGGPSANARIGDYVDAEIVRASQRG